MTTQLSNKKLFAQLIIGRVLVGNFDVFFSSLGSINVGGANVRNREVKHRLKAGRKRVGGDGGGDGEAWHKAFTAALTIYLDA